MKIFRRVVVALGAVMLLAAACGGSGSLEVEDARYRVARSDLGAGYMTVTNSTGADVTLQSATSDAVGRIELHESFATDNGTMAMEERPDGFVIPAGETITLEPGGKHLMMFDPVGTDDITVSLNFDTETVQVVARYDAEASAAAMDHGDMDDMDHGDMDAMDHGDMDHDSMDDDG